MEEMLHCTVCGFEYNHLIGTIEVKTDDDSKKAEEFIIAGKHSIKAKLPYEHRSQGNIHLLFQCESGHFFIKSFDGHKGNVHLDANTLMTELSSYLTKAYEDNQWIHSDFNYELIGNIEKFLLQKQNN